MATNLIQTSFFGGELSPSLYGMVDLAKYKSATALMRNYFADYRGGTSTRFGTKYVIQALKSNFPVRLITFQASFNTSFIMEFGELYIRFHTLGGPVIETPVAITGVNIAAHTFTSAAVYAAGDWVFISGVGGVHGINGNYYIVTNSASPYTVTDLFGNPPVWTGAFTSGGTAARIYTIPSPYHAVDLALVKFAQNVQFMVFCHPNYPTQLLTFGGPTNWTLAGVVFGATVQTPVITNVTQTSTGGAASGWSYIYGVTAVDKNGQESAPALAPFTNKGNINILGTPGTGPTVINTITWLAVPGAVSYNLYRVGPVLTLASNTDLPLGTYLGLLATTSSISFVDGGSNSGLQIDFSITPPLIQNPFLGAPVDHVNVTAPGTYAGVPPAVTFSAPGTPGGATAKGTALLDPTGVNVISVSVDIQGAGYLSAPTVTFTPPGATATAVLFTPAGTPAAVPCYIQQRLALAAPLIAVQTVYFSQPGSPYNFNITNPIQADDAITAVLVSKQLNTVKSMVPMPAGLVVLTASSAFLVYGSQGAGSPITATSIVSQSQAYNGASDVPPITANDDILYVQSKGSIVRDLRFNFYTSVYTGIDISVLSEHLFFGFSIKEWAWAEEPFKLVWAVRNDGKLLSLTFSKEQEIYGWAHHDTQGFFESTAAATEVTPFGGVDATYFVIRRTVNGQSVQYIERMADRFMPYGIEDAWCLDCAIQSQGTFPQLDLAVGATSGNNVMLLTSAPFFTGQVGNVIRIGGGILTITSVTDSQHAFGNITQPITDTFPDGTVIPGQPNDWSVWVPATTFSGLAQLEGQQVTALADGNPIFGLTVVNGSVTLPAPATKVVVGLPFTPQLQNLPLETGQPTVQGKRKRAGPMTLKVFETRGLSVGRTFGTLVDVKDAGPPMLSASGLIFGDEWMVLDPWYDPYGQICIQQDNPWPVTVLAIVPQVEIGDK
jgi:hypothetical protein